MKRASVLLAGAVLTGCSMAPHYVRPPAPVPPVWPSGDAYAKQQDAALPAVDWRAIFHDPRLQKLIEQAFANNRDLRIAAANIAAARAQYRIQRAQLLPVIGANIGAGYAGGGIDTTTASGVSSFSADAGVSAFQLDLFGRVRSLTTAQQNLYFATAAGARATRLTLIGDIANGWLNRAADASLLRIAEATVASAARSVDLTRRRLEGGIAPRTDLRQAEQLLASAEADVARQRALLAQDANALRLLVGAEIDPALLSDAIEDAAPTVAALPAGLDSRVLLRRPDVVQAEYQLRAANAQIGAARAALFPNISLTGLLGFASDALRTLFAGGAFNWQGSGSIGYTLFQAGAGRAGVAQSKAQRDVAVATYEKAIQTAFREVSDALARRGTIDAQRIATEQEVSAAADNYKLTDMRYRGGIDTFLSSLDAQRTLYTAQQALATLRLTEASNLVTLYTALGGDATLDPDSPPS